MAFPKRFIKAKTPKKFVPDRSPIKEVNPKDLIPDLSEGQITNQVARIFLLSGFLVIRINGGGLEDKRGRFVRFYTIFNRPKDYGHSDLVIYKNGRGWFVEIKKSGESQEPSQKDFQALVESFGMEYVVVESAAQANEFLKTLKF